MATTKMNGYHSISLTNGKSNGYTNHVHQLKKDPDLEQRYDICFFFYTLYTKKKAKITCFIGNQTSHPFYDCCNKLQLRNTYFPNK